MSRATVLVFSLHPVLSVLQASSGSIYGIVEQADVHVVKAFAARSSLASKSLRMHCCHRLALLMYQIYKCSRAPAESQT